MINTPGSDMNVMVLAMLKKILGMANAPEEWGGYVAEQICELWEAKLVVIIRSTETSEDQSYALIGIYPEQKPKDTVLSAVHQLARRSHSIHYQVTIRHSDKNSEIAPILKELGSEVSIITPLESGNSQLGLLLIIDPQLHENQTQVTDLLHTLSGVMALRLNEWNASQLIKPAESTNYDTVKSESKFRALVEASSNLIWETNMDGVYTYVSPQIEKLLGYSIDEIIFTSPFTYTIDDEKSEVKTISDSIVKAGTPFNSLVNKYRHKNGNIVYLETSGVPFFDENGQLSGYRGISRDITEHKINEITISRFKKIFDLANFGTVITNTSYEIEYVNRYFAEIHGFENKNLIGKQVSIFHTTDQFIQVQEYSEKLIEKGQLDSIEIMHHHQSGYDFPMLMNALVLYSEKGEPELLVATALDITDRKLAEHEIQNLNTHLEHRVMERTAQLQAANKELEAFSYSISHDLRAPLRHIDGFINLFLENKKTELTDEEMSYLNIVTQSAIEMGELIDALLSFSRLNRAEIQRVQIDSATMINQLLKYFKEEFKTRKIQFITNELLPLFGDYNLIRQVWMNLISNAIKYTRKKDIALIEIGSYQLVSETVFFIKDNGAGFNMKYKDKLFGVFQRLHKPREFEGIGIGLANVNRIISRHGGNCWAEGELNIGATFYFSLPNY